MDAILSQSNIVFSITAVIMFIGYMFISSIYIIRSKRPLYDFKAHL